MRTGDVVDLSSERRLSAALDFAAHGAELLVLNGGSRAEELTIETIVAAPHVRRRRAAYCIDAGTSMQLVFPLLEDEGPDDMTVRIVGGSEEILLAPPARRPVVHMPALRGGMAVAAAATLLIVAGGHLSPSSIVAVAEPVPAALDAGLVAHRAVLRAPDRFPHIVARAEIAAPARTLRTRRAVLHPAATIARLSPPAFRAAASRVVPPPAKKVAAERAVPQPHITDLRVPSLAKSGDVVPVAFHADARKVRIVASIGPTVVAKTLVNSSNGVVAIRPPNSDRDGRVMTVRAYAQNGSRVAMLQAMVVLVSPQ
ncbi:MAG: hypothetical protein ABR591_04110 [Candidatus Velthaea sp.]